MRYFSVIALLFVFCMGGVKDCADDNTQLINLLKKEIEDDEIERVYMVGIEAQALAGLNSFIRQNEVEIDYDFSGRLLQIQTSKLDTVIAIEYIDLEKLVSFHKIKDGDLRMYLVFDY